jgi:integral membrane protein (TIGR01906 family)
MAFYEHEFEKNGTYEQVQMEKEDLLAVTTHMLNYLGGSEPELNIETTVAGKSRLFFSKIEIAHMIDVKGLFEGGRIIFYTAIGLLIVSISTFIFVNRENLARAKKTLGKFLFATPLIVVALTGVLGLLAAIDFNAVFTKFHETFFSNDLWILDPRVDLLINIVPLPFFMDIVAFVIGIYVAGLVAMASAGFWMLKSNTKK